MKVHRWFRTIEMARLLGNRFRLEVRVKIQFLCSKIFIECAAIFQDRAVKSSADAWLNGQGPDFYPDGLNNLVLRCDKSVASETTVTGITECWRESARFRRGCFVLKGEGFLTSSEAVREKRVPCFGSAKC
ncbi:hypothetical protein TNCV_2495311 [Trichonephila clavipes]|nr:hypothetical protein TNCV_2495311 [Trichonephila clavipes]